MKVKATKDIVANLSGSSVQLVVGQVYDVTEDDADNLIRGNYAELVVETTVKTKAGSK